jgi:GGDEF domain-containing protein
MTLPVLVHLGGGTPARSLPVGHRFATWRAFFDAGLDADGFYLSDASVDAMAIRRSPWWDRAVYTAPGIAATQGVDGQAEWGEALLATERMRALRQSLALNPRSLQYDEKLLYFLYLREPGELVPELNRSAPQLYRFPAADVLAEAGADVRTWITSLTRRGLLEPALLIDRTRHCERCGSAHQHFLDVCPHCASMHIHKGSSLHCFSCGHVGPEPMFMGDRGLQCPQCATRLRHIGVDYDRPLTQYSCASCHHAFIEAAVQARCLDCSATADPGRLAVHEVSTLRLSLRGRAALRAGHIADTYAALEGVGFAPLDQFKGLADWALTTQQRHPDFAFAIVMVELDNVAELVEAHGSQRTYLMLDEFARRLRELLRISDVASRTAEERLWLLLPYASIEGFQTRLAKALATATLAERPHISLRIEGVSAPKEIEPGERVDALMARLQERRAG